MNKEIGIKLVGDSWFNRLKDVMNSPEFDSLGNFVADQRKKFTVYPPKEDVFKAFRETPFDKVKIIILAQDPYHGFNQATGLAFANPDFKLVPQPSLRTVLDEVNNDIYEGFNLEFAPSFELIQWAHQGVLLLNCALTVREKEPNSHHNEWLFFTKAVIQALSDGHTGLIWMLWGKYAQSYSSLINDKVHHILTAGHPATKSYGKDTFSGCKHFSQANKLLEDMNGKEATIKW